MKSREGFVSNSSSTSFLLVYYQAKKKVVNPQDYRQLVEKKYSVKTIKKYALDYFTDDDNVSVDDFDKFPPLFWKEMWKEKKHGTNRNELDGGECVMFADEYDVPPGLKLLSDEIGQGMMEGCIGVKVGSAYESDIDVPAEKLIAAIEKMKAAAPANAEIKVLAGEVDS